MILQNWHISSDGNANPIDQTSDKTGYDWIHIDGNDPAARKWLIDDPEIDALATETLLADDSRPRTITHGDSLLINLRGVNLNEGSDATDMVGIRFIVTASRIVSVERHCLKATEIIAGLLANQPAPNTPTGFIAAFALTLVDRMVPTITDLSEKVDDFEDGVDADDVPIDRTELGALRRDIIALRRYLAPQRDAVNNYALQSLKWITERDRLHLRNAADQTTRITEELDALRERCAVIRDQLTDQRAEEMNRAMMILSVVSAVFLPLGLLSGMMGINVGGMPWASNSMGFWYIAAIVIGVGVLELAFFKLLKWV